MTTTFSPTSPTSSSPPLSPDLSKDDSQPFHITVDRSSAITHPFPSPGSGFIPPPKPGVLEFTLPQTKRSKKNNSSSSPSSTSAPGSGTNTPNNVSTSSIAQSNRNSAMMDVDLAPLSKLSNGTAVPSDYYKSSGNESAPAASEIRPASESSPSSQPQPYSQPNSALPSSSSSALIDTIPTASNAVSAKASSLSLGSGRATPTPSNVAGATSIARTSSTSSASSKAALSSSRPAPPSPTPSRTPSQSRSGSRRQSRLSSTSGTGNGANPSNSPMTTAATNGTTTPSKRLSTLSNLSVGSNPNQNKRLSTLSNISTLPTVPQSQVAPSAITPTTSTPALPSTSVPQGQILIRDFAFPIADKRHTGEGADAPKVIKKMQKKYGPPGIRKPERGRDSTSASASSSCASSESGSRRGSGFGFGWGTNAGGWWSGMWSGFGSGNNRSGSGSRGSRVGGAGVAGREDEDPFTPTLNDLSRNFNTSSSSPGASQPTSPAVGPQTMGSYGDEERYDDDEDDDSRGAETPLLPGLYKALFDFIPEGTAEMGLREGDIVRVAGESGGVGWAVVMRGTIRLTEDGEEIVDYIDDNGNNSKFTNVSTEPGARTENMWALVPESYLEVWRLDRTDDDDGQLGDDEQ